MLWGPDYDGGHKAWVRWVDGSDDIVGGSRWNANVEGVSPERKDSGGGLSLQTLLLSSLGATAAAIIVPMFWERGSLIATAVTPIIVAVVVEALRRPAQVITTAAPRVTRRSGTGVGAQPAADRRRRPAA